MSVIASDVCDRARIFLNDSNATLFTNTTLLPYLKAANDELSDKLVTNGLPVQKVVASTLTFVAGSTEFTPLPNDLIVPVALYARETGQSGDSNFLLVKRSTWPQLQDPTSSIGPWDWREQRVRFVASTISYDLKLEYERTLTAISGVNSVVEVTGAINYLASKTAELAARFIGQNAALADQIKEEVKVHQRDLMNIGVQNAQGLRARRKPFKLRRLWRW